MFFRFLPWEYAVRNLFRRPLRTALTFTALTTVIVMVLVVIGFVRGLERSLAVSGDPRNAIVFSLGMAENVEYSAIPMRTAEILATAVAGMRTASGEKTASPELYLATEVDGGAASASMGLIRGVTERVIRVRRQVEITAGDWPGPGEVLVGHLAAEKLGIDRQDLELGQELRIEGRTWRIAGRFAAAGAAFESEIWCRLEDLQQALKRSDVSVVAVALPSSADFAELDLFCKERLDLELQALPEQAYYASLQRDYYPVRVLAWVLVILVSGAGVFAGLNTMYGSVVGRTAELSMLQTLGFVRRAIVISLIQEGLVLAAAASLVATGLAVMGIQGAAVRFTMGAFPLRIDGVAVLIGCGIGLMLGLFGAIPPAVRALRMPIVEGLRAV